MTRKLLSVLLSMCVLFSALLPTVHAKESEPAESTSAQNCHTMTQQWFGDKPGTRLPGSVGSRVSETLANYFAVRENSYKENAAVRGAVPTMGLCSSAVQKETAHRTVAILDFEKRVGINILDAESTIRYEEDYIRYNEDGTVTVYLYEWTFFDYDDLSDNVQTVDVSGYGVYHKVTLEAVGETYSILADEYDESDMLGICTMNQSTEDELIAMDYEPVELANAAWEELQKEMASTDENSPKTREMYAGYNPDAAVAYADKYVYHGATGNAVYEGYYNSAYANFNGPNAGDCANYTSQSIYAGGMPQVVGTPYGTDGWYYKTSTDRSGTWTSTTYLRTWMGNNRGTKVTASNSTIFKGSPVFYNNSHTTICVGKNSAGTPIINSHNYDVYHGVWNYFGSGTTYTTVQLTATNVVTTFTIDSRYPTPFKAYTISSEKVVCYNSIGGSSPGKIYPTDECTIQEIYTNGWCKLLCPWSDGSTKTVYVETAAFIYDTSYIPNDQYLLDSTQGYIRNDMSATYKWCDKTNNSKWFLRVGKTGPDGYTQVIYWIEGDGNYLMWIKHAGSDIDGYDIGSDFYAYIINMDQWRHVTNDSPNVSLRTGTGEENQIWKFEYKGNGYYSIINCADGNALDVLGTDHTSGANVQAYTPHGNSDQLWMLCGRWTGEITLEPQCSTKCVLDVADNSKEEGANIQIWEYNATGAQKFALWTDLPRTVTYDANGGVAVPEEVTKQYRTTFSLSSEKPTGVSYKITLNANGGTVSTVSKTVSKSFKNWNTIKDGSGTAYDAGASFTIRTDTVLYAQWYNAAAGTLATPSRTNYTFDGWYTSASGGNKVTSTSVISANTTLYAHWTHVCASGHSYSYKATTNPTISATGTLTGACSKCSGTTTVSLPKLNTTDYTKTVTKAATCTATGTDSYKWKTTTYGSFTFTATTAALGHSYTTKVAAPTCTAQGYTTHTCSRCSDSYKDTYTNATGHSYTSKVTTAATCTKEGVKTFTCSKCSHSYTEAISATGHTVVTDKAVAATCTTDGKTEGSHCSICNAVIKAQTPIPATGHSYTSKVTTPPDCTNPGVMTYTCSKCPHSYTEPISATGHTPVTDKAVAATCTTDGKTEGSHCSVCNAVIKTQTTIPATGHSYTSKVTTAATCTNAGVKTYTCSKCSHSYTEAIAATGHTAVTDKAVAATCTTDGKTEGSHCSICNAVITAQTTVAALGHSYTSAVTAPTCTEQGYTTHTCSRCSDSYKDSYTNATGHSYSYTDKGETHEAVCGKCSHSFTEAHSYTDNACVCGAIEILAPITDENIVINHSLNLASDISINYAVKTSLLSGYDSFYMEIQVPVYNGNALTGLKTLTIQPVLNGNYYYFTMVDLTAMNMNDILVATLHMNKGKQEYVSKPDSYSVATYALGLLNMNGVAEELKILGADLLRYGAAAQIYKDYRTDTLATSAMTAAHKAYLSDLNAVTFGNTNTIYNDLSNPMITWAGKTMNLGSKVVVKFVFNAGVYTGDISKLTLRMIYQGSNGTYRTVTLSNPTVYNEAKRMYAFEFDGLMAAELRTPLSVAVYSSDTQLSQTMQYSADTYGNSTNGTLLELCKALFAYSDSAKAYFTK